MRTFEELYPIVQPYTMLGPERLENLYRLTVSVCISDEPGDIVECGVWKGGATAMMAAIVKDLKQEHRVVHACDSFMGLPQPIAADRCADGRAELLDLSHCAAPHTYFVEICQQLGVLNQVNVLSGWFKDRLPEFRTFIKTPIRLLHMDGDFYESTRCILDNLYDRVSPGGYIQIDDYGHWEGCAMACRHFQEANGLHFDLHGIDGAGVWFQKS